MRRLAIALCLLMEASTGNAKRGFPRGPTYQELYFNECLRKGLNAEYCECWATAMPPPPPPEVKDGRIVQPPYNKGPAEYWANARCENPLRSTSLSEPSTKE